MSLWWLLLAALVASWLLTGFLRRYALARNLMDIPNARSSHQLATPRGGGMAIVLSFLFLLPALFWGGRIDWSLLLALTGAGGCVAAIGFLDDHGHMRARWRLLAHFLGAAWGLYCLGGLPPLEFFGETLYLGWLGHILAAVYLVWLVNLYNFMDGIDGIAGNEAITVCLGGAFLFMFAGPKYDSWMVPALLLAAVAGFLVWNFPPARIFMGDAGSGFLGMALGLISLYAAAGTPVLLWSWVILLGVFVVDATVTLLRRVVRGERFYEAHRTHAYQYASRLLGEHKTVSVGVGVINLLWLLPLALVVERGWMNGLVGVMIAYAPLVWLAFHFKAGAKELQRL